MKSVSLPAKGVIASCDLMGSFQQMFVLQLLLHGPVYGQFNMK
jgi:hypothetical protein